MITATPTCKLNTTITVLMTLGKMCRKMILSFLTPLISASFTKSRSRAYSTLTARDPRVAAPEHRGQDDDDVP